MTARPDSDGGRGSRDRQGVDPDRLKGSAEEAANMTEDATEGEDAGIWARATAPQTPYSGRQVGIGLIVFVVGVAVTFGIPLVLT